MIRDIFKIIFQQSLVYFAITRYSKEMRRRIIIKVYTMINKTISSTFSTKFQLKS